LVFGNDHRRKIWEVKKQLKNGVPAGEIREEMIREGYSKKDIEGCFEVKKYDMRSWWLISAIVFFLGAALAWAQPAKTAFHGSELDLFILSAGLFIKYIWPKQKKKNGGEYLRKLISK
jgi:hypothetical protein